RDNTVEIARGTQKLPSETLVKRNWFVRRRVPNLHHPPRAPPPPPPPSTMGLWDAMYRVVMRRNGVYVTFVVAGAFAGERLVDYGVNKVWEMNNVGKRYQDISVLGQRPVEE
uniref:Complex III subunit 9 n=4 Tax=Triticinae TaxID=1648030 RepID=A0A8R7P117_TRIUA